MITIWGMLQNPSISSQFREAFEAIYKAEGEYIWTLWGNSAADHSPDYL